MPLSRLAIPDEPDEDEEPPSLDVSEENAEEVLGYDCAKRRPPPRVALLDHLLWSLLTWGAAITLTLLWCAFLLVDDETTTFGPAYAPYARV